MGRSVAVSVAVVAATVFAGSTPVAAADNTAVKRIIVVTVLKNLGVDPTAQLVDQLVGDISLDDLDSLLVKRVAKTLDSSGDATTIISQTVDSDGDGIPDENAATESAEADDDDDDDDDSSGNSGSGTSNGGSSNAGSGNSNGSNGSKDESDDESDDEPEDEEDPDDEDDEDDDDHGGDN